MSGNISFFDVDHTLTSRSTGYQFAVEAVRQGAFGLRRLASVPFLYLSYRLGHLDPGSIEGSISALAGIPRALLDEIADRAFAARILPDLRPGAANFLAERKAAGDRVVLATSSLDFVVRPLASYLGVDAVIASALEFADGLTTGRFAGGMMFGQAKLEAAKAMAARLGASLSDCAFFSDSVHDLPLLLASGRPVAVHPDRKLAREARSRGWEVRSFA